MYKQMLDNLMTQSQPVPEYMIKSNKLMVESLEKVTAFQMTALKSYVDLGMARVHAAAEVHDPQSLKGFVNGQLEATKALGEKFMADSKAAAELGNSLKADFSKLARDGIDEVKRATKAAA